MKYVPLKTGSLEERPMLFDTKKNLRKIKQTHVIAGRYLCKLILNYVLMIDI